MRKLLTGLLIVSAAALQFGCSSSEADPESAAVEEARKDGAKKVVAAFGVPEMTTELVTGLTQALAEDPGIVETRQDLESGVFVVTFNPESTSAKDVFSSLMAAAPEISLVSMKEIEGGQVAVHDCEGCPSRNQCQGGH